MKISINLPGMYRGESYAAALEEIRAAGYDTVECWGLTDAQAQELAAALEQYDMRLCALCPDFFVLNDAARREEYAASLEKALQKADMLRCPAVITQVGQDTGAPREEQHRAIVEGLRAMLPLLHRAGKTLLVEPLNDVKDHPGYYLTDSEEGFAIIREVGDPHVRLLYDIYHQLHMGEDVQSRISANLPLIGHFHAAGFPRRDEALFSGFDYAPLLDALQAAGVTAPLGLECKADSPQARARALGALRRWNGR